MSLAMTWLEQEHIKDAEERLTQALELSEKINGRDHVDSVNAIVNLGPIKRKLGDYRAADRLEVRGYKVGVA